jgi:hypothetical protein
MWPVRGGPASQLSRRSNFRPTATKFEDKAMPSSDSFLIEPRISLHEVRNEDEDSINRFCRLRCDALIDRDTGRAGKAAMHEHKAKSARVLVLASDRRTEMLVRRQVHAFQIIVGVACAGFSATEAGVRSTEFRW